jgi:hypothetical protein
VAKARAGPLPVTGVGAAAGSTATTASRRRRSARALRGGGLTDSRRSSDTQGGQVPADGVAVGSDRAARRRP